MAFEKISQKDFSGRAKNKGKWKCSRCQGEIRELPFRPEENRPIYCRECYARKKAQRLE